MSGSRSGGPGALVTAAPDVFDSDSGLLSTLGRAPSHFTLTKQIWHPHGGQATPGAVSGWGQEAVCHRQEGQHQKARSHRRSGPPARDPSPPVQNWLGSFLPSVLPPTHQGPASLDPTPAPQRAEDLQCAGTTQGNRGPAPPQEHHAHWVKPFTPAVLKPRLMSTDCVPGPGGLSTWWGLRRDPPRPAVGTMGTINQSEAGRAAPGSSLLCGLGQAGLGSQAGGGRGSNIRSGADQTLPQSSRCCCSREGWPYLRPA